MADRPPILLSPISIRIDNREFATISNWPFADAYVGRLLRDDIPQRVKFGNGRIWLYYDPAFQIVGFGTIDVCDDYREYSDGRYHPYIPLLAVNPAIKSFGYGTSIVQHLIDEAALLACSGVCHDVLFLDVYTSNQKAIAVYNRCGFVQIEATPRTDEQEDGKQYIVMAKRVSISPG